MAKASRSSKKQPDFDPSELEDLIFSPAVGRGVGSHLVSRGNVATVVMSREVKPTDDSPVDAPQVSTVATSAPDPLPSRRSHKATEVTSELTTVDTLALPPIPSPSTQLWITEHGDLVSAARVKRIRLAQDAINSAEESVYDTLWNAKLLAVDERDASRLVQAGYDYLVKRTRLSRKTIQRIIAKLLEKDFIAVDTRADIYQRTATVYRVFSYKSVLDRNVRKGRLYVAKMGPGFSYARPLGAQNTALGQGRDMTTVDTNSVTPVVSQDMATVVKPATVTVVKTDQPTVVKMSPYLLDSKTLDITSSSGPVRAALGTYGAADDDVAKQLMAACRSYAPDCTDEEIVHFIHEKGRHVQRRDSRVVNPVGFLLTAVPKCFSGELLTEYRSEQGREAAVPSAAAESEDPALLRWRREQEAALGDPSVSEQEKHLIRLCLGLNAARVSEP